MPRLDYWLDPEVAASIYDQLHDTKEWQLLRGVGPLTMQYLLVRGFFKKVQYTPHVNVWQVRLTKEGREQVV